MKVLVVHNAGQTNLPSGEQVIVTAETQGLDRRGIEVHSHIVTNDDLSGSLGLSRLSTGLRVVWSHSSFREMRSLIKRYKPDVVHFHSVLPLLTVSAFYACKSEMVPVVHTLHNYRWFCVEGGLFSENAYCDECLHKGSFRGIVKRCSRKSTTVSGLLTMNNYLYVKSGRLFDWVDRFIAVSQFVRNKYIEAGFPQDRVTVKYNGIDLSNIENVQSGVNPRVGITFVGRLTAAKGTSILKEIMRSFADIPINIVGDGPDFDMLKQLSESSARRSVRMLGKLSPNEIYKIMSESTCVVVPSLVAETFGLVAIEAMACGTPVVASQIGGLSEIVQPSGGGVTLDPNKPQEFVSAIRALFNNPKRTLQMGAKGKEFVQNNFTIDSSVDKLLNIYQQVIEGQRTMNS